MKLWRATEGSAKEVFFFAQQHHPGHLSASDFVHMTDLEVSIQRQIPHLLYHFALTYSNWESGRVLLGELRSFMRRLAEYSRRIPRDTSSLRKQPLNPQLFYGADI